MRHALAEKTGFHSAFHDDRGVEKLRRVRERMFSLNTFS